jgi:Zn-dependent protease
MFLLRDPLMVLYTALALLIGLAVHEASHAFAADKLGDPTARSLGRLTLNPLAHLDPTGAFVLIISSLAGFGIGWGKPVPVNPRNFNRGFLLNLPNAPLVGMAIVALAGPVSNVLLALLGAQVLLRYPELTIAGSQYVIQFLDRLVLINVILAIFNMIPIPPLDGYRVLLGLLPTGPGYKLARLEPYGPGVLILLVFLAPGVLQSILRLFAVPVLRLIGAA